MLPDKGYSVYLFGSILYSNTSNDIDVLVAYDKAVIAPNKIHSVFHSDKCKLEQFFKRNIHCAYLNFREIEETNFIKNFNCRLIEKNANNDFNLTNWTSQFAG